MWHSLKIKVKHATRNLSKNTVNAMLYKRMIMTFVEKNGMVYFGSVNQHTDNHRLVRGFTVSPTHQDDHYSVGSVDGYDVTLVGRSDILEQPDGSMAVLNWLVMTFDLHTKQDIPHFFIHAQTSNFKSYKIFFTLFPAMKKLDWGNFKTYPSEFTSRFSLYSQPSALLEIEQIFTIDTARVLGSHFWPFSAEFCEGVLYLYSDNKKQINPQYLKTMLKNGLWLANHLDLHIDNIAN